ncbi:MAG: hypothetical protein GY794_04605 [bacterium]|nr:hypothetical protein [bacterium]
MHSSTSSFKTEWKVLAVVLVVLGVCECWARLAASGLDYDRAHIAEFPAISRKLHQSESPRVLFLGNSLTMHGVVLDEVRAELDRRGVQCTIDRTVPVATDVTDWIYLYERYFRNVDQTPDIVVVGFVRHHVKDLKPPKRLRRLGRHFLALSDMPECFAMDIPGFDERAELLLSRYSALFGDQLIYRENVLYSLLPDFKASEKRLNRILTRVQETAAKDQEQTPPTFERIGRLAKLVKDTGARGVFVAMPLPDIWDTDPQVEQAIKEMGMTYIDARKIDGITPEDFPDGYHMGEKAKLIYSRFIAARLAEQLNIDIN